MTSEKRGVSVPVEVSSRGLTLVGDAWAPGGGTAGAIVLLHGGGQRRHSWRRTGERLARLGWHAYAFDARGHGESDRAPDGDYTSDALISDLAAIIRHVGEPPVVVGASMGGLTALIAVGEGREPARGLVLVDAVARIERSGLHRVQRFMLSAPEGFASLEEAADVIAAYAHKPRPRNVDGLRKNLVQKADGRWYWHWDPVFLQEPNRLARELRYEGIRDAARAVAIPTLLVRGVASDVVTADGLAEMKALIPHARVAEVHGASHMVAGDDNDVFTAQLSGFLDGLSEGSAGSQALG